MITIVHGTAVAINGNAILMTGASGSGKSDLALRLIDRGARLIADDQVIVSNDLELTAPEPIKGKLEIRGIGIVAQSCQTSAPLRLLIELGDYGERHPIGWPSREFCGWSVHVLQISAFAASAPIRIEYALNYMVDAAMVPVRLKGG